MLEFNWWFVLVSVGVVLALLALLQWRRPELVGLKGKTAWDALALFMAPVLIVAATAVITGMQQETETRRAQEAAVQSYIDRVSALVLGGTADRAQATAIGRAHTSAVLQLVDQERAGRILVFLDELGLVADYVAGLEGLDLTGASLKGIALDGLDLEDAILRQADLEEASLTRVDFEFADLRGADLKRAAARHADFEGAQLEQADFADADLRGADLSRAIGLTSAQLANSCLDATTVLPPGFAMAERATASCGARAAVAMETGEGVPPAPELAESDTDEHD